MTPKEAFFAELQGLPSVTSPPRLRFISSLYKVKSYLEIGVRAGETFNSLELPVKVGVDPNFVFDYKSYCNDSTFLYPLKSDDFFTALRNCDESTAPLERALGKPVKFDLIFIDGLHTFEQSLKDFENSRDFAHDNTVWMLDDTVPSDPYSALPDMAMSYMLRKAAGLRSLTWHGDVYKSILAIHDKYPEYSYCTVMWGNPQTVIWKAPRPDHAKIFSGLEEIAALNYFDIFKYAKLFMPTTDILLPELIGKTLSPWNPMFKDSFHKLLYTKIV